MKVFVPCLLSLEVKCIFLHSGLLLSKIYFIKQTFVINECVVFTCGPVSNKINHFHLISLCTDSYLTFRRGLAPSLSSGRGRRRTRRLSPPPGSPHQPFRSLSKDTKRAPHSRRRKAVPHPPKPNKSRVKTSFLGRGGEKRADSGGAARRCRRCLPALLAVPTSFTRAAWPSGARPCCPQCRQRLPVLPRQLPCPHCPHRRGLPRRKNAGGREQFAAFVPSLHLVNRHEFTDGYLVALRCCNTSACVLVVLLCSVAMGRVRCVCVGCGIIDIGLS